MVLWVKNYGFMVEKTYDPISKTMEFGFNNEKKKLLYDGKKLWYCSKLK